MPESFMSPGPAAPDPTGQSERGPELADVRRYGRRLVKRFVAQAREDERPTFGGIIEEHLGVDASHLPIAEEGWPGYEHVNVQSALDAWLDEPGREHSLIGVTNYRHRGPFGLSDLLAQDDPHMGHGPRPGNVSRVARPAGPGGVTRECLRAAVLLVTTDDQRVALLFRGPEPDDDRMGVSLEIVSADEQAGPRITRRLRELTVAHNVYRGHVVSFGRSMFGDHGSVLRFHERQPLPAEALILPSSTFDDVRRQVVGVARSRDRLRAAGQHLKRGLLLYGPPGVGKTHTVRYLIGELTDTTIVELSGDSLHAIKEACSIARSLQPAMIVVEDVDLIAEQRDHYGGETPLLFTLLNEMDGLDQDADVVFLLTTNRADLLEPALAARPGRVDQAVHIDLPDRESRGRLLELYRGSLELDTGWVGDVLDRTDGHGVVPQGAAEAGGRDRGRARRRPRRGRAGGLRRRPGRGAGRAARHPQRDDPRRARIRWSGRGSGVTGAGSGGRATGVRAAVQLRRRR